MRRLRTDLSLLEDYLSDIPASAQALASDTLYEPQGLLQIDDLVLRLLLIKVAESTADSESYQSLQSIRRITLDSIGGKEAATRIVDIQENAWREELPAWKPSPQGPAISIGTLYEPKGSKTGIQVHIEAGLHDLQESSSSQVSLKEVRFFSGVLQQLDGITKGDFTLVSLDNLRAFTPVRRAASNGINLGYSGLPNSLGLEGLFASAWSGLSFKQPGRWTGGRLTLAASDIGDQTQILAVPGIFVRQEFGHSTFTAKLDYRFSEGSGWNIQQSMHLTEAATFNIGWLESPTKDRQLFVTLELRF